MSASLLAIHKLITPDRPNVPKNRLPAYMVVSTAPYNVEDAALELLDPVTKTVPNEPSVYINEIVRHLEAHPETAEVLVVIHGYNTSLSGVRAWFEEIHQQLEDQFPSLPEGLVLIGYRWPSEQIVSSDRTEAELPRSMADALVAKWKASKAVLPVILGKVSNWGCLGLGVGALVALVGIATAMFSALQGSAVILIVGFSLLIAALVATAPIATVLLLRLVGYFRDNYRANYYGVPDFVELIRQIDAGLVAGPPGIDVPEAEVEARKQAYAQNRIKLSFIGHSMGGFVVTNAVRILSDVFDADSIGTLDAANPHKDPSSKIGNVFCLGRLVLVSPDIPAETIISGRANFLKSSLRRFEEAYLFSNEGDMALRLASTAANYFSFPTRTQDGGYRLGNVIVRSSPPGNGKDERETFDDYGIVLRLPNELLVKVQSGGDRPFGTLLGAQFALVNTGQPTTLQGQPLVGLSAHEAVWPADGALDSLKDRQIVRLPSGQVVSLQASRDAQWPRHWSFLEVEDNHLCRIQSKDGQDELFSLMDGDFIKLEFRRVARIHNGQVEILKPGQAVRSPVGKLYRVEGGQLFEDVNGLLAELHEPLQLVQDHELARFHRGEFVRFQPTNDGQTLKNPQVHQVGEKIAVVSRFPLDYLYIREKTALSRRQGSVALAPNETPIGEVFSFFDCTDYIEPVPNQAPVGLLSRANQKKALGFWDYVLLTWDYFSGKIDTHGGYFVGPRGDRPAAAFTRMAIYGIAALGFEAFLEELSTQEEFRADQAVYTQALENLEAHCPGLSAAQVRRVAATQVLSSICQRKHIQVLLSERCYRQTILGEGHGPAPGQRYDGA